MSEQTDREPKWIEEANCRSQKSGLEKRFRYELGSAEAIPFPDCAFDLVTCQTLLIHVPDPVAVSKEMLRVLKPGGLLVVAEPNNLANRLMFDNLSAGESITYGRLRQRTDLPRCRISFDLRTWKD